MLIVGLCFDNIDIASDMKGTIRMIVKKTILLTDEDKYLLSKPLPTNPCEIKCKPVERQRCCGCSEQREYRKAIKSYEDAGILEIAKTINEIRRVKNKIESLKKEEIELYEKIPIEVLDEVDELAKVRKEVIETINIYKYDLPNFICPECRGAIDKTFPYCPYCNTKITRGDYK